LSAKRSSRLDLAYARIEAHESALTTHTVERLRAIRGLRLYGITDPARVRERTPTFCFNLDPWRPDILCAELADGGLFTYHGNYCAIGTMTALDLEASGGAAHRRFAHQPSDRPMPNIIAAVPRAGSSWSMWDIRTSLVGACVRR